MTREEAKSILHLCPPSREPDRDDPQVAAALAVMDGDDELRQWFEDQRAFDARFADALSEVSAPESLKDSILGARDEARADGAADADGDPPTRSRAWWRNPWLAAAAVIVLLFIVASLPRAPDSGDPADTAATAGVPDVIAFLGDRFDSLAPSDFARRSSRFADLEAHLGEVGAPTPGKLPQKLDQSPAIGCVVYDYRGTEISMICFGNTRVYHLATMPSTPVAEQFDSDNAVFEAEGMAFRVWRSGDQFLVLSVRGPRENLPEIR